MMMVVVVVLMINRGLLLIVSFRYSVPVVGMLSPSPDSPSEDYANIRDVRHLEDEISTPSLARFSHALSPVTPSQTFCRLKCSSFSSSLASPAPQVPWAPAATAATKATSAPPAPLACRARTACVASLEHLV